MNPPNPSVDGFIRKSKQWQDELNALRAILLQSSLTEDMKWRVPCYTFEGHNVVLLGRFKDNCVLSFVKGALLKDPDKILTLLGENTQSARVVRFTDTRQIAELEPVLRAYIEEAVQVERSGLKVEFKKTADWAVPEELQSKLDATPAFKTAFAALTPGRQRAYLLHVSSAKQSKTRTARVDKCTPRILAGKGLDDE